MISLELEVIILVLTISVVKVSGQIPVSAASDKTDLQKEYETALVEWLSHAKKATKGMSLENARKIEQIVFDELKSFDPELAAKVVKEQKASGFFNIGTRWFDIVPSILGLDPFVA